MYNRCAFWIASKEYLDEAHCSLSQFRQKMPDIKTYLFYIGNTPPGNILFDECVVFPPCDNVWYLQSVEAMLFAFRHIRYTDHANMIYFDTDTYLVEPVYDIFDMMERDFDFIAAHAPGRKTAPTVNLIPDCFPEFNIGVCGFANNSNTGSMLMYWLDQYEKNKNVYGNNDQAPLRETLWSYRYRVGVLPPEYNFRFNFGGFLRYPVKVLHGRHPDLARVANSANKEKGMRLWKLSDMN